VTELQYLDSLQGSGIRPGLARMRVLLRAAGHPEKACPAVIVAGTNGKGSTAAILASILNSAGVRCGLYTSPHLVNLRERWNISGEPVSSARLKAAVRSLRALARRTRIRPTYFEALTVMAFLLFRDLECELVVLEVGMGGRLDATNVVRPLLSLVSSISIDHTSYLGGTLRAIAREKAGVIHRGATALTSNRDPVVLEVLRNRAERVGAPLRLVPEETSAGEVDSSHAELRFTLRTSSASYALRSPLPGLHQLDNISLAVRAAEELRTRFPAITPAVIEQGVAQTAWRGRLERFFVGEKIVWVDGGHNVEAAARIAAFVDAYFPQKRTLVFGIMGDKEVSQVISILFPRFSQIILTEPPSNRAAKTADLSLLAQKSKMPFRVAKRPAAAFRKALDQAPRTILVFGSLYLAGDAVRFFEKRAAAPAAPSKARPEKSQLATTR
jgi:dihydrofolate synthase/folylpolyglutamate synthase